MADEKITDFLAISTIDDTDVLAIVDLDVAAALQNKKISISQMKGIFGVVASNTLNFQADSGGSLGIILASETLTLTGGNHLTTVGSGNSVAFDHDTVAATSGTYSASSGNYVTGVSYDAYNHVTAITQSAISDLAVAGDSGTGSIILDSETLTISGGNHLTSAMSVNTLTINHDTVAATAGTYSVTAGYQITGVSYDAYNHVTAITESVLADLDVAGNTGTGSIVFSTETFSIVGDATYISTAMATNTLTISHIGPGATATTIGLVIGLTYDAKGHITGTTGASGLTQYQVPYVNAAGTGYEHNAGLTFDTSFLTTTDVKNTSGNWRTDSGHAFLTLSGAANWIQTNGIALTGGAYGATAPTGGWLNIQTDATGILFNSGSSNQIFSNSATTYGAVTIKQSGGTTPSLVFVNSANATQGYIYGSGGEFGILESTGNWAVKCAATATTINTDTGTLRGTFNSSGLSVVGRTYSSTYIQAGTYLDAGSYVFATTYVEATTDLITGTGYLRSDNAIAVLLASSGGANGVEMLSLKVSSGSYTGLPATAGSIEADAYIESNTGTFKLSDTSSIVMTETEHKWRVGTSTVEMELQADGDLHVEGDVIFYSSTTSDRTWKDYIKQIDIKDAVGLIKDSSNEVYKWNKGSHKGQISTGLIAQDVEKYFPYLVKEKGSINGYGKKKTLNYVGLHGIWLTAFKDLYKRIEKLEHEL